MDTERYPVCFHPWPPAPYVNTTQGCQRALASPPGVAAVAVVTPVIVVVEKVVIVVIIVAIAPRFTTTHTHTYRFHTIRDHLCSLHLSLLINTVRPYILFFFLSVIIYLFFFLFLSAEARPERRRTRPSLANSRHFWRYEETRTPPTHSLNPSKI